MDAIIKAPEGGEMMTLYSLNNTKYEEIDTSYYGCGNQDTVYILQMNFKMELN